MRGRRVALLAHAASVDRGLRPAWELLAAAGARIVSILSPEHGLWAEAQDMEAVRSTTLAVAGAPVPVHSLYGEDAASLEPDDEQLAGAQVLVVDLVDVGARYYTFSATADLAAAACLRRGVEVVVTDRPNPIGGDLWEGGPGIDPGLRSFVGHFDVPHRHGLTLGELVRSRAGAGGTEAGLRVVRAGGWTRGADWDETGLPWVVPSPNMPALDTALVYPGACLLEGTNLSEGRGTTRPFETLGAPFLDGARLAGVVHEAGLGGAVLRPLRFRPMFHKHGGRTCGGVFVHVTDRRAFRPLRTYLAILWAARHLAGDALRFRTEAYEFRDDVPALDLLWGTSRLRELLDADAGLEEVLALADAQERRWTEVSARLHLY